jgi:protocatechuate 3,4-dioxygenase beta subunit
MRKTSKIFLYAILVTIGLLTTVAYAAKLPGAIFTTTPDGSIVNENVHYESKLEVYLDGGPPPHAPQTAAGLPDGRYVFQVTDPSGKVLLSEDPSGYRVVEVANGIIIRLVPVAEINVEYGLSLPEFFEVKIKGTWYTIYYQTQDEPDGVAGVTGRHDTNTDIDHCEDGAIVVQLMPFYDTPNPGGVYKAWMIPIERYLDNGGLLDVMMDEQYSRKGHNFIGYEADPGFGPARDQIKTDNFKVLLRKPEPTPEITVLKFHDENANALWDEGEPEIAEWPISITDPLNITNNYATPVLVLGVPAGEYLVTEEYVAGWMQSVVFYNGISQGTVQSVTVTVTTGDNQEVVYGNFMPGKISGYKYEDVDGDGVYDAGEPGAEGVTIEINGVTTLGDIVSDLTTTDSNGYFEFTGLIPGSYTVSEVVPEGWVASTPTSSGSIDILSGDAVDLGYVFGNYMPAMVSGYKYHDLNGNGVHDEGEPGLAGVVVTLDGTEFDGDLVSITDVTDESGEFSFSGLAPGEYTITETVPAGYVASTDTSYGPFMLYSQDVLILGKIFGNVMPMDLDGYKFEDVDADGVYEDDPGVEGVKVTLSGTDGMGAAVYMETWTDADGYFYFEDLWPGSYTVSEEVPEGWVASTPTSVAVTLVSGSDVHLGFVFGNYQLVDISAFKYFDANANGVNDPEELPLAGILFTLNGGDPQYSGEDGYVHWYDLEPGTYTITEDLAGSLILGLSPTTATTHTITLYSGETAEFEFGNYGVCAGLTPGYWKNWRNHYIEAEFEILLEGTIAGSIAEADAIFDHWDASDPSDLTILNAFILANQLTINLTQHPELPNPSGGSMFYGCLIYYDGEWASMDWAMAEALAIHADVGSYEDWYIIYIKNILDVFANSVPSP